MKSIVSIVKKSPGGSPSEYTPENLECVQNMLSESVRLIGGFDKVIQRGSTAFIKANIVTGQSPDSAVCTDLRVLEGLVKILKEKGCGSVTVGEGASVDVTNARMAFQQTHIDEAVRRAGGEVAYLDEEEYIDIDISNAYSMKQISLPKRVLDADIIVSSPKMKTHIMTLATLGIKNLWGLLKRRDKQCLHNESIHGKLIDITRTLKPDLTIIDGLIAGEGCGPIYPNPVHMDVIVSSTDIVAADAVASAVMGVDPFEVTTTALASKEGLGVGQLDLIEIRGKKIEEVRRYFRRPKWNPIGFSRNVKIFAGGACRFCMAQIAAALERLKRNQQLDEVNQYNVIVGYGADKPQENCGKTIIVGDCAYEHSNLGFFVPGCPPLPHIKVAEAFLQA